MGQRSAVSEYGKLILHYGITALHGYHLPVPKNLKTSRKKQKKINSGIQLGFCGGDSEPYGGEGSSAMGIRQLMEPDSLEEDAEKMIFPSSFMRKRDGKIKG